MRPSHITISLLVLLTSTSQCLAASLTKKLYLEPGQRAELAPGVSVMADQHGPGVLFGAQPNVSPRNFLYLDKKIEIWSRGTRAKAELLGVKRNVLRPQYVIQVTSESSGAPQLSTQPAGGKCDWNYNNPASTRDKLNFATVSRDPFLMIGSRSDTEDIMVVTNYGVAAVSGGSLRPSAIKFQKKTGEILVCPWNEKLRDYDIPNSARGHGIIRGPVEGRSSLTVNIGPSKVVIAKEYPKHKFTADITVEKAQSAPREAIILNYEVPDFYSASLGMPTYVEPTASNAAPKLVQRFYKPDAGFPATWRLKLNPPIVAEFGMGPNGLAMGEVAIICTLWKFGDKVYGSGGYRYSDCGLFKGGQIEGTITGNKMSMRMAGTLDLQLEGTALTAIGSKGNAVVSDSVSGSTVEPQSISTPANQSYNRSGNKREFALIPDNTEDNKEVNKFLSDIALIPPGTEYWNALCALPGNYGSGSILTNTLRLVQAERSYGWSGYRTIDKCGDLAHMQYCAWLESANSRGKNHAITLAHAEIAEKLYKRVLDAKQSRSQHQLRNYSKMLKANGKLNEAKFVDQQIRKLPNN